jgi:hypothetical protein
VEMLTSLAGLSARLRLPRPWLHAEAAAGRIPCLKIGRKLLFNPDGVEKALAERAASGPEVPVPAEALPLRPVAAEQFAGNSICGGRRKGQGGVENRRTRRCPVRGGPAGRSELPHSSERGNLLARV